jgi:hypothetical protein
MMPVWGLRTVGVQQVRQSLCEGMRCSLWLEACCPYMPCRQTQSPNPPLSEQVGIFKTIETKGGGIIESVGAE